jgi:hypothetical protein
MILATAAAWVARMGTSTRSEGSGGPVHARAGKVPAIASCIADPFRLMIEPSGRTKPAERSLIRSIFVAHSTVTGQVADKGFVPRAPAAVLSLIRATAHARRANTPGDAIRITA